MNLDPVLKLVLHLAIFAFLASCAPASSDFNLYQAAGSDQSSIIGGTNSTLDFEKENGIVGVYDLEIGGLCTGSLIGDGLVLTAGHCANVNHPEKMIIFSGVNFDDIIKQVKNKNYANLRRVIKVRRHENFDIKNNDPLVSKNDISLIRFQGPAINGFKNAILGSSQQTASLKIGTLVTLAGYGLSEFKQDPSTGQALISKGSGILRQVPNIKVVSLLSTGEEITFDQSQGHGACHGDSGGPAYLKDPATQKNYLIGVTSRGGGNCNLTAVYTGVIGYSQWIQDNSKQLMQ